MSSPLDAASMRLRQAYARVLGVIDACQRTAVETRESALRNAQRERERQQSIVRNRASQVVTENRLRARDVAADALGSDGTAPLDAADHVVLGRLSAPGAPWGVNEEVSVPFVVPLIGRGGLVIETGRETARRLVETVVLRALEGTAPGQLDVIGFDPGLTSVLSPFSALRDVSDEALRVLNRSDDLEGAIRRLVDDVQRVNDVLRGGSRSLLEFRATTGHPVERYQLVVLFDYPTGVDEDLHRQILALARAGADAGVSFVIVVPTDGPAAPDWWRSDDLRGLGAVIREENGRLRWPAHPAFEIAIPEGDAAASARTVEALAALATSASAPKVPFERVQPLEPTWGESSAERLRIAIGISGSAVAEITLGDEHEQRHNILITGAVGQGKSNLLKVLIHSLGQRYAPEELELHLLDFKEGVTLYPMAPRPGAPDFLPHARVLGLESDRDFGLAVLRHIEAEFARRAKLFRPYGDSISRYRAAQPDEVMPRIVIVIDEFHMLFDPNDRTAEDAAQQLEAIARRGRSYGVHLVLASQTISGVAALMTREGGIFAQFPIRLALKNATQESFTVLGQGNDAAARLRARGEAVLNLDYGHIDANRRIVVAAADDAQLARLRRGWWDAAHPRVARPIVFDGSRRLRLSEAVPALRGLRARAGGPSAPAAVIGYPIDVSGQPLAVPFAAEPGRNLAILGAGEDAQTPNGEEPENNAIGVLQAAAVSLALQHPAGDAEFLSMEMLDDTTLQRNNHEAWCDLMARLGYPVERIDRNGVAARLQELAAELEGRDADAPARYLIGFGLDRATTLDVPDLFAHRPAEDLQQVLRSGPPQRVHLLGWWANAATFRSHIGFGGEGFIDAMLVLRLDQSTVQDLLSSPFVTWSVRDNRGLLSDRTQMPEPTTIIPFSPLTPRDVGLLARAEWEV